MYRWKARAKRSDRRRSPLQAPPTTNRNPPTGIFRPSNPPHLWVAGGYPPQAGFFPRTRKDPACCFEHRQGPCLTCGRTSECTALLEEDAFLRSRPRVFHMRDRRGRNGAVAWQPSAPLLSPARQISPQHVSQTGRRTPLLPPKFADADTTPPLPQSPLLAAKALVNGRRSRTYAQVTAQGITGDTKPDTSANSPPMTCHLCRHRGHRQTNCLLRRRQELDPAGTGLYACLVGECSKADVAWTQMSARMQAICLDLANPDCHWLLASGEIFLCGLSKTN